jgi:adenylosuccinate lyase
MQGQMGDAEDSGVSGRQGLGTAGLGGGIDELRAACARKAEAHRGTVMIGRSHGIHAEPITAGLVFAGFYSELGRARRALVAAREEISVGKIAGAIGIYASLSPEIEIGVSSGYV